MVSDILVLSQCVTFHCLANMLICASEHCPSTVHVCSLLTKLVTVIYLSNIPLSCPNMVTSDPNCSQ